MWLGQQPNSGDAGLYLPGQFFQGLSLYPRGNRASLTKSVGGLGSYWVVAWRQLEFLLWGLYYFILIFMEKRFLLSFFEKLPAIISRLYLGVAVLVGWVLFYHLDLGKALEFLGVMFGVRAYAFSSPEVALHFMDNALFLVIATIGYSPLIRHWVKV